MIIIHQISPFQGLGLSWLRHFIGRCPMLVYEALSGLFLYEQLQSPERVSSVNDGRSPSGKNKNKKSPEGVSSVENGKRRSMIITHQISPFQGLGLSWLRHFIGRCPMLAYEALSGLFLYEQLQSPERVSSVNDGCSPSGKNKNKKSPEGVSSVNGGRSPSDKNKNKKSPEGVSSVNDGRSPSGKNKNKKSPEGVSSVNDGRSPSDKNKNIKSPERA